MNGPSRSEIAENWTGPDYQTSWTCMTCETENPDYNSATRRTCRDCGEEEPYECEKCEEPFIRWQEFKGDRYETCFCQKCYFDEPDPSGGIDRDQGEDR